jgi:hypothetical protein
MEGSPSQGRFSVGRAPDRSAGLAAPGQSDPEATARVAAEHGLIEQLE